MRHLEKNAGNPDTDVYIYSVQYYSNTTSSKHEQSRNLKSSISLTLSKNLSLLSHALSNLLKYVFGVAPLMNTCEMNNVTPIRQAMENKMFEERKLLTLKIFFFNFCD